MFHSTSQEIKWNSDLCNSFLWKVLEWPSSKRGKAKDPTLFYGILDEVCTCGRNEIGTWWNVFGIKFESATNSIFSELSYERSSGHLEICLIDLSSISKIRRPLHHFRSQSDANIRFFPLWFLHLGSREDKTKQGQGHFQKRGFNEPLCTLEIPPNL